MAQSCSIQAENRLPQLQKCYSYRTKQEYKRYKALCKIEGIAPKPLLTDVSYYDDVKEITSEVVAKKVFSALTELYNRAKNEDPEKRAAKRAKIEQTLAIQEKKTCNKCNGRRIMYLHAHSRDSSAIRFPSGVNYDGYFPYIPNLCGNDDVNLRLCVDCGSLVGFDPKSFNEALFKAEYLGFTY